MSTKKKVGYAKGRYDILKKITGEAKRLRNKDMSLSWKDAIKKAGELYHRDNTMSKPTPKKAAKKIAPKKVARKKISGAKKVLTTTTRSSVIQKKQVAGGIGAVKKDVIKRLTETLHDIEMYQQSIDRIKKEFLSMDMFEKRRAKEAIKGLTKVLSELKTHARELKKHI
jgi:uncharacterized membrane protein YgaE (UPF0421/DUF939 family)